MTQDLAAFASLDAAAIDSAAPKAAYEHLQYVKSQLVKEFGSKQLGTLPDDQAIKGLIGVINLLYTHLFIIT